MFSEVDNMKKESIDSFFIRTSLQPKYSALLFSILAGCQRNLRRKEKLVLSRLEEDYFTMFITFISTSTQ